MYTFYERFYCRSNTSTMLTKSIYVHRVVCHENGNKHLYDKLVKKFGSKAASSNKNRLRIYVRFTERIIRVKYRNQQPYKCPKFQEKSVVNAALGIKIHIESDK